MYRKILVLVLILAIGLMSCAKPKTINGIKYDTYGLFNSDEKKNPNIQYEVNWVGVVLACILFETIIVPIYVFGFSLYEPVGVKPKIKGALP